MKITRALALSTIAFVVTLMAGAMTAHAAPLTPGTVLKITPGVGSGGFNNSCTSGSCFGWYIAPGYYWWTNIPPGTDGGFVVGKSQVSGGQETNPVSKAAGQLTAMWLMSGPFIGGFEATLYTTPDGGSVNLFDDTSCTKVACIGKTALKTLYVAVNGASIPIGSAAGCDVSLLPSCTADQQAGIFVNNYSIDLVGKTWSMDYSQVASSYVTNAPSYIIFRGTVHNCPIVDYAWAEPTERRSMMVFGWNLRGVTSVIIDGVNAPVFQPLGDDLLWVLPPAAVTYPWKPGTVQVTNANAGCSSTYPRPIVPVTN